ncbi:hypothetical protein RR48_12385 [Papilio machaon]|uniref:Uncharacterized protein n=1 Tax=Papilio machaon TaxID=76193 RepID=A0A194QT36_PAPMA|nr:hypothetical protein RR48_12385 [Papilio machaon]
MALLKLLLLVAVIGAVVCDHDYTRRSGLIPKPAENQASELERLPCHDTLDNCDEGSTQLHTETNKKR